MFREKFYVIAHNIRSLYNVGTIFRTADALGISKIFLTGYTGQPPRKEISKVALGAEKTVAWEQQKRVGVVINKLKKEGVKIIALETGSKATDYKKFKPKFPLALILGNEVAGISGGLLQKTDKVISLPMAGEKESLNVGVAMGAAGYYLNNFRK
ncbi:MAG: TrmH family RNA methyltransferase [Patescibacteria group bacterium]|nr:TrmH family RNA methyltransferase [Patescibacteria group bacterium]MDD5490404.1 TrmH family RNA methyltransferase [Patescibacteria group bacterium]